MPKIPSKKTKKFYYRRATWTESVDYTLEQFLRGAHDHYTTTLERTFPGNYGTEMRGAKYKDGDSAGVFLQVASYVPDQPTSIIPKASSQESNSVISAVTPPEGNDFLDGDIFLLVKG